MATNAYVTPAMIRLFLLDRNASDNFLLDDVDFEDALMDLAITLTVDRYNTTDPFIDIQFTVETFPYRYELLLGIAGQLLRSKAINMRRNQLNYTSAAGTAVDDKQSADLYMQMAEKMLAEFDTRIRKLKTNDNINQGYGFQGSSYVSLTGWL